MCPGESSSIRAESPEHSNERIDRYTLTIYRYRVIQSFTGMQMHSKRPFRGLLRGHLEHFREMHGGDRHGGWYETAGQRKGRGDPEGHGGGHHHHGRSRGDGFGRRSGFGGRGGGGGRIFGPGDLRLILLGLIAEKPSHGYELIRAIEERV